MIVHKFGGTSIGGSDQISNVVDIIIHHHRKQPAESNSRTVVVVSAMSGVTDLLNRSARSAARGEDSLYREIKAQLLKLHLEVVETLLSPGPTQIGRAHV